MPTVSTPTTAQHAGINVSFLQDVDHGGASSQPQQIARQVTHFVEQAQHSIHIAIYDFRLQDSLGADLVNALIKKAQAGLSVKIAYDHTKPNTKTADAFHKLGGDPAPKGTDQQMKQKFGKTGVQTKAILTIPASVANQPVNTEPIAGSHLMHSKYIVRDVNTPQATVLMGSANFTDDAWTHQENNIVELTSAPLAQAYETDFQELWTSGNIKSTGTNDQGTLAVSGVPLEFAFSPGEGRSIESHIANLISQARRRIKVASMVITSQQILGALSDALQTSQVAQFAGIYDGSEMDNTIATWKKFHSPQAATFQSIAQHMVEKHSNPFSQGGVHNFMHNKVTVCDDAVVTGSFNFSKSATMNAENCLVIQDAALADQYSSYIDRLVAAYSGHSPKAKKHR